MKKSDNWEWRSIMVYYNEVMKYKGDRETSFIYNK